MVMRDVFYLREKDVHVHFFFLQNGLHADEFEVIYLENFLVPN